MVDQPHLPHAQDTDQLLKLDSKRPSTARSVPASVAGVSSPLCRNLGEWRRRLRSHPDQKFAGYILNGLENGFRVGFDYSTSLRAAKHNMPSALKHPDVIERYLGEERSVGRILGPIPAGDATVLHVNRFGVIPKESGGSLPTCPSPTEAVSTTASTRSCVRSRIPRWIELQGQPTTWVRGR
jgi:hypothetical protein